MDIFCQQQEGIHRDGDLHLGDLRWNKKGRNHRLASPTFKPSSSSTEVVELTSYN